MPCHVILLANAETVITADQVVRGGKVGDLKKMVDKAVAASPCVKRVFVVSRTGADVPMGKLDIPLEKVAKTSLTGSSYVSLFYGENNKEHVSVAMWPVVSI